MTVPESSPPSSSLILYQTEDGQTRVQCRFEDVSIWLTQALIGGLFQKDVRTINEHLQNVYSGGELTREATIRKFRMVRQYGEAGGQVEGAAKKLPKRKNAKSPEGGGT